MNDKIAQTIANLTKNRMTAQYAESKQVALNIIKTMIPLNSKVAVGGSVTLRETGIQWYIEDGDFEYTNRYIKGTFDFDPSLSLETVKKSYLDAFTADYYLTSSNAVTVAGELINVDGQGNRVAAMIYGPQYVIVVVGKNKIVDNLTQAEERLKAIACPKNNQRHQNKVPCVIKGHCLDCHSPGRSCCSYTLLRQQRISGRINVIIVNEDLGY